VSGSENQAFNIRGARPAKLRLSGIPLHVNFLFGDVTMPRYFPSARGWVALLLPLLGGFLFLALIPTRFTESGVGRGIWGRVSLLGWVSGGLLILVSVGACVEAFRRGSMADRVVACVAALVILWLSTQYFELFLLPVRRWPNRVGGRITLPPPTPPSKRVRTRRFRLD
jgi:hypothetical protein